ncbi:hypothetical protein [uncultured Methanobacterium sp.]|uniref:hypothetical protein n=1 Tax=uncultured Methanobacterium sp. TaxID=176306 RepID=UPI002AA7DCEE|nr:hypothetical protein [uncultured Methanobacterium sp.]
MPDLGPLGRGGARRRTRRRMTAVDSTTNQEDNEEQNYAESRVRDDSSQSIDTAEKLEKLAKLLIDKGVITQSEYDLIFG